MGVHDNAGWVFMMGQNMQGLHAYIIKQITAKQAELEDPSNSAQNKLILAEIKVLLNTHNNLVAGLAKGLLYQG